MGALQRFFRAKKKDLKKKLFQGEKKGIDVA